MTSPRGVGSCYAWTGLSGSAWNAVTDWRDLTLGIAAVAAPGAQDRVAIAGGLTPLVVTGPGAVAAASVSGAVLLDGAFQFGTLDVQGTLTLAGAGSQLALGNLGEAGAAVASSLVVGAASLTVAGGSVLGSLATAGGSLARLGSSAVVSAGITVDGGSCVEVGSGGSFWPGWLKVFANGTLAGSGAIAANTLVQGTVLASGLRFGGLLAGAGQVQLDASGATVGTVLPGVHLVFAAPGACLTINPGTAAVMAGTLVGFGAGDAIDLLGQAVATARFATTDATDGILSIAGPGGAKLGQFLLAGNPAAYAAATFLAVPDGSGGTLLMDLPSTAGGPASAGNATPHREAWTGLSGSAWSAVSDWRDLTLYIAAVVAPGGLDRVAIAGGLTPLLVTGPGAAAAASVSGAVLLDGAFQFGTLDVQGTLTLAGAGSQLALGNLGEAGAAVASSLVVGAASLTVAGGSVLGSLATAGGSLARLGSSAVVSAGITVDGGSCVEVGSGGSFWPGWLKVFANGTLAGSGAIAANTLVQGTVLASGLRFGGLLAGAGQVQLDASGATLGTVLPGVHLVFAAPGACLTINPGTAAVMAGTLVGFGAGDAIDLLGQAVATARFTATDATDGILSIAGPGGAKLGQFLLAGNSAAYAAATFLAVPNGSGGTLLMDLPSTAGGPASAGNATPHREAWTGLSGSAWSAVSDWRDLTLGAAAVAAPGVLDSVAIAGGLTPLLVTGPGAVAAASVSGAVLLDGAFQFGTLDVEGTLTVAGAGSQLTLGNLGEAGAAVASSLVVDAASLTVAGGSVLGSLAVAGGSLARLGSSAAVSAGITVDGGSCVEVGSGGSFWPGWLKVFANGTLAGSGAIAANTLVQGTVLASGLRFGGLLGGAGQVRLDASGATVGTVLPGLRLVFAAPGACLTINPGTAAVMAGTLVGFGAGDAIDLLGQAVATARFATTDATDGILSIAGPGGAKLGQFLLAGNPAAYAAATFLAVPDGSGGSFIIEAAPAVSALLTHPS